MRQLDLLLQPWDCFLNSASSRNFVGSPPIFIPYSLSSQHQESINSWPVESPLWWQTSAFLLFAAATLAVSRSQSDHKRLEIDSVFLSSPLQVTLNTRVVCSIFLLFCCPLTAESNITSKENDKLNVYRNWRCWPTHELLGASVTRLSSVCLPHILMSPETTVIQKKKMFVCEVPRVQWEGRKAQTAS